MGFFVYLKSLIFGFVQLQVCFLIKKVPSLIQVTRGCNMIIDDFEVLIIYYPIPLQNLLKHLKRSW